jgi:hypothetical protein
VTAQIVSLDFQGHHNTNLTQAVSRVRQGATWKKQRIIVLVPSANTIAAKVYLSHMNIIWPPNQGVIRWLCLGDEVGVAYSEAIEAILSHPELSTWEYVLTLEHDNMPPPDGILQLIESMEAHPELSCVGGLYWTKGFGGCAQIWGDIADPVINFRPQVPRPEELQECYGTGMGFNLWRVSMFREGKLKKPFFKTMASKEGVGTQDLVFWSEARKHGYRCAIDNRVKVGHYDKDLDMVW